MGLQDFTEQELRRELERRREERNQTLAFKRKQDFGPLDYLFGVSFSHDLVSALVQRKLISFNIIGSDDWKNTPTREMLEELANGSFNGTKPPQIHITITMDFGGYE